jgi:hypothetical protein
LPTQVLTVSRARCYLDTPICRYKVLTKHNLSTVITIVAIIGLLNR